MTHFSSIQNYWTSPDWLSNRMLMLSGPRQVGKTTLVQSSLIKSPELYFNWDLPKVRAAYRADSDFFFSGKIRSSDWICFDEIHKRAKWKDILKGVFDQYRDSFRLVVTGSALLETFKKSGDSLVGRYFTTHLFPINLGDFRKGDFQKFTSPDQVMSLALEAKENSVIEDLLEVGGFPEPFYRGKVEFWKRWSEQHLELIVSQDMRDITQIQNLDKIQELLELLVPNIGSQVSNSSLSKDLEVAHTTVRLWLSQLEKVQLVFPVRPYSKKLRNVFKKETKWYFTDWCVAQENRFENYVACLLHRATVLWKDRWGEDFELHYVATHQGAEVDFLLTLEGKPFLLVEAKAGKPDPVPSYFQFSEKLGVPCLIVTQRSGYARKVPAQSGGRVIQLSVSKLGQVLP